jgi:hypothetical protein
LDAPGSAALSVRLRPRDSLLSTHSEAGDLSATDADLPLGEGERDEDIQERLAKLAKPSADRSPRSPVFASGFLGDPSACPVSLTPVEGRCCSSELADFGDLELGSQALDRSRSELVRWRVSVGLRGARATTSSSAAGGRAGWGWLKTGGWEVSAEKEISSSNSELKEGTSKLADEAAVLGRECRDGTDRATKLGADWERGSEEAGSTAGAMIIVGPLMASQAELREAWSEGGARWSWLEPAVPQEEQLNNHY